MALELFHNDKSTCSQKVRLCLAELELDWVDRHIDLKSGENLEGSYVAINPNGVVPTLIHDGSVVIESTVICEYLCEVFPDPCHLLPATALERAKVRAWLRYIDEVPSMAVRVPTFMAIWDQRFGSMSDEEFSEFTSRNPLRRDFFERLGASGSAEREKNSAAKQLTQTVERMCQALLDNDWLCGDCTIADLCMAPVFQRLIDLGNTDFWNAEPAVQDWLDRMRARKSWPVAFYPGSYLYDVSSQRDTLFARHKK